MLRLLLLLLAILSLVWMTLGDLEEGSWLSGLPVIGMAHNPLHNNGNVTNALRQGHLDGWEAYIAEARLTAGNGRWFVVIYKGRDVTVYAPDGNVFNYLRADAAMHGASRVTQVEVAQYFRAYTRSSLGGLTAIGQSRAWWCDALGWFGSLAERCGRAE